MRCLECDGYISYVVTNFSLSSYGIPLCVSHQRWIEGIKSMTSSETIRLYFALKSRGVPVEIEKFDGYKHIDIAIPEAKMNIEVDGIQHNLSAQQALSDLKRTYYSFLKGYITIRIPNSLLRDDYVLEETADYIVGMLNESVSKNYRKGRYY
ncbi:endonuclease domain-containing protein [Flavobacterium sp. RHBU_3]|uniref:endonuclease domain-containing protein n=1 Tax=Flavobacterium sp. RHBU_3 TaxID=3391184 RepID=UPI0039853C2E